MLWKSLPCDRAASLAAHKHLIMQPCDQTNWSKKSALLPLSLGRASGQSHDPHEAKTDVVSWKTPLLATGMAAKWNNIMFLLPQGLGKSRRGIRTAWLAAWFNVQVMTWGYGLSWDIRHCPNSSCSLYSPNPCGGWYLPTQQTTILHHKLEV